MSSGGRQIKKYVKLCTRYQILVTSVTILSRKHTKQEMEIGKLNGVGNVALFNVVTKEGSTKKVLFKHLKR